MTVEEFKIFGLYDRYPRRYGKSKKIIYSKKDFTTCVNRDNGFRDVYISVFSYNRLKEVDNEYRIDSDSAILDKIYIDMDFKDWVDYDKEKITTFANNLKENTKGLSLSKKEKGILKKILEESEPNEEDIDIFYDIYEKYDLKNAEKKLFNKVKLLERTLKKWNVLRVWVFTGGGFHLYLYVSNKPNNKRVFYRNVVDHLSKIVCEEDEEYINKKGFRKIRKLWDPHCPPKLSQMARVIGSKHPRRKNYCISLVEQDIAMGLSHIKKWSKSQNNKIHYLGNKLMKFSKSLDNENIITKCSTTYNLNLKNISSDLKILLEDYGILWEEIPPCMINLLIENSRHNYTERFLLITFLYRCGLSEEEVKEVLKLILTPDRLYHCCGILKNGYKPQGKQKGSIEYQVKNIITNDYLVSCKQMKAYDMCNPFCRFKDVLYHFS